VELELDRGTRLIAGVWLQALGGATFVLYGVLTLLGSLRHGHLADGPATTSGEAELIEHLVHAQFLIAVFACTLGVGMAAIALFGVRNGQWWAWVTGVLGCAVLGVVMVAMLMSRHAESPVETAVIMTVALLHALGSLLTRPYVR
jgi:formate-dependent nitrite reductase membrane component NrfD